MVSDCLGLFLHHFGKGGALDSLMLLGLFLCYEVITFKRKNNLNMNVNESLTYDVDILLSCAGLTSKLGLNVRILFVRRNFLLNVLSGTINQNNDQELTFLSPIGLVNPVFLDSILIIKCKI